MDITSFQQEQLGPQFRVKIYWRGLGTSWEVGRTLNSGCFLLRSCTNVLLLVSLRNTQGHYLLGDLVLFPPAKLEISLIVCRKIIIPCLASKYVEVSTAVFSLRQ